MYQPKKSCFTEITISEYKEKNRANSRIVHNSCSLPGRMLRVMHGNLNLVSQGQSSLQVAIRLWWKTGLEAGLDGSHWVSWHNEICGGKKKKREIIRNNKYMSHELDHMTKAAAWAAGFGFRLLWAGPKPLLGRHQWPGLARLGPAHGFEPGQANH